MNWQIVTHFFTISNTFIYKEKMKKQKEVEAILSLFLVFSGRLSLLSVPCSLRSHRSANPAARQRLTPFTCFFPPARSK